MENKRGVVVSSIVGLGFVLVVVVAVVSSQGGAVPLPGGEIHKSIVLVAHMSDQILTTSEKSDRWAK